MNVEGLFLPDLVRGRRAGRRGRRADRPVFNAISRSWASRCSHKGIAVIILGGMGDIRGALLGGLFLGFAEVLSVAYVGSNMRDAVAFGLLFLVLLVRPKGLFGSLKERKV
jgi:branched-chain amino acid transport system permease protein